MTDFVIGRWYKNIVDGDIGKLTGTPKEGDFPSTEYFSGDYYTCNGSYFNWNLKDVVLADPSEYQHLLPDGNPDKHIVSIKSNHKHLTKLLKKFNIK